MPSLKKPNKTSKDFLILAQARLKLAESAYAQKNFSDTISLLAQSVELASKSFLSNADIISESDFLKIGHIPSKGFEKSIDKIDTGYAIITNNLEKIELTETEKIPDFDIRTIQPGKRKLKTMMSGISQNPQKLKSIPKKGMQTLLLTIKNLQNDLEISRNKIYSDPAYLQNCADFQKDVFKILDHQQKNKEIIQMLKFSSVLFYEILGDTLDIKEKAIVFHNIVNVTATVNILSIITQSHAISSRYKVYKETDMLIKNFPQIKMELENALDDLETIYAISDKNIETANG